VTLLHFCLFLVYVTNHLVPRIRPIYCWMLDNELERVWKKSGCSLMWSPDPEFALGDLGKYWKLQSENRSPVREINSGPPKYETGNSIRPIRYANNAFVIIALRYCFHSCYFSKKNVRHPDCCQETTRCSSTNLFLTSNWRKLVHVTCAAKQRYSTELFVQVSSCLFLADDVHSKSLCFTLFCIPHSQNSVFVVFHTKFSGQ
jgi:hypothetical protein